MSYQVYELLEIVLISLSDLIPDRIYKRSKIILETSLKFFPHELDKRVLAACIAMPKL